MIRSLAVSALFAGLLVASPALARQSVSCVEHDTNIATDWTFDLDAMTVTLEDTHAQFPLALDADYDPPAFMEAQAYVMTWDGSDIFFFVQADRSVVGYHWIVSDGVELEISRAECRPRG